MKSKLKTNLGELQEILNKQILRKSKKKESWDRKFEITICSTEKGWEFEK